MRERPAESLLLTVEEEGLIRLPEDLRAALSLGPKDLLSLTRNEISLRLDLYRELLDAFLALSPASSTIESFLQRPLTEVQLDGCVEVPAELMPLKAGSLVVLEVVREGPGHALYLYPADGEGS